MAGTSGRTTGLNSKLYFHNAGVTVANYSGGSAIYTTANEVKYTTEIGDIAQEANTVEYSAYGESTSRKATGITSLGDFTFSFALDNVETVHDEIVGYTIGGECSIAIVTKVGAGETGDFIRGTVAGRTKSFPIDGVQTVNVTIAMTEAPKSFDK